MGQRNPYLPSTPRELPAAGAPFVVEVTRGVATESLHEVHAVIRDVAGGVVSAWGDGDLPVFPRSTVKLIQAIPFVDGGYHGKYGLDRRHLALACASHHGEPRHVDLVGEWLRRLGLEEAALECGAHDPAGERARKDLWRSGGEPCALHNNCSGKHAGMLTGCVAEDLPTAGYSAESHPWQRRVRQVLEDFLGLKLARAPWGLDGCGLPTWSVPLASLALAAARIADPGSMPWASSVRELRAAVTEEPWLVGGELSFCSRVIAGSKGKALIKVGAEGTYIGSLPDMGLGIAVKARCGTLRAAELVMGEILRSRGIHFSGDYPVPVKRWTGEAVGEVRIRYS